MTLPTGKPTASSSSLPSVFRSLSPSSRPTNPTSEPTLAPSVAPSVSPSTRPSATPSAIPTVKPTKIPSAVPTASPSAIPSALPTSFPSCPTTYPSVFPTNPTSYPSLQPSQFPSYSTFTLNDDKAPDISYSMYIAAIVIAVLALLFSLIIVSYLLYRYFSRVKRVVVPVIQQPYQVTSYDVAPPIRSAKASSKSIEFPSQRMHSQLAQLPSPDIGHFQRLRRNDQSYR